jgi:hypothetical protein
MSDTKKSTGSGNGAFIVCGLLLICVAAAYLTVVRYQAQVSSTGDAKLLYEGQVMASFAKSDAPKISEGMSAIVTIRGYSDQKFLGRVKLVHLEDSGESTAIITLKHPPSDAQPPTDCKVTVDTTITVSDLGG